MPLRDELRRACLNGPEALQALIRAKGLQLGAELNVLREVLRAIVLDGAQPGVLDTEVGYTGGHVANATYQKHDGHVTLAIQPAG